MVVTTPSASYAGMLIKNIATTDASVAIHVKLTRGQVGFVGNEYR